MTYDEQTAVRLVRTVVNEDTCVFVRPLKRDVLRSLLRVVDELQRENTTLRQQRESFHNVKE